MVLTAALLKFWNIFKHLAISEMIIDMKSGSKERKLHIYEIFTKISKRNIHENNKRNIHENIKANTYENIKPNIYEKQHKCSWKYQLKYSWKYQKKYSWNTNIHENNKRNIHTNVRRNMRMHQSAENESSCCQKGCAQLDANYLNASSACLQMYTFIFVKCSIS